LCDNKANEKGRIIVLSHFAHSLVMTVTAQKNEFGRNNLKKNWKNTLLRLKILMNPGKIYFNFKLKNSQGKVERIK
jgi:hypothetical protein